MFDGLKQSKKNRNVTNISDEEICENVVSYNTLCSTKKAPNKILERWLPLQFLDQIMKISSEKNQKLMKQTKKDIFSRVQSVLQNSHE